SWSTKPLVPLHLTVQPSCPGGQTWAARAARLRRAIGRHGDRASIQVGGCALSTARAADVPLASVPVARLLTHAEVILADRDVVAAALRTHNHNPRIARNVCLLAPLRLPILATRLAGPWAGALTRCVPPFPCTPRHRKPH